MRSLHRPEQLLWPPLSLSSRSSLTSGRELLEARARVCLRSAPARDPGGHHAHHTRAGPRVSPLTAASPVVSVHVF